MLSTLTNGKAEYYAFISHKSADAKFALKLQKFIESYNLPTNIRKIANVPTRRLTPVCSYEVDFSSNPLMDEMREKLKRSKYLILVCSEALLKTGTQYVNYEVRTFIECKKEEGIDPLTRIIPIIVTGEFGSEERDCCPEALKELGDNCPIALDRQKYKNDRELFLHVISGLLDIDYAVIENRDTKRQRSKRLSAAAVLVLLSAIGIGLGEYYIPRQSHYVDFVMQDGLPVGIGSLSADAARKTKSHYVITESKHKIQSLEYVNSHGSRIDHNQNGLFADRPSAYIFQYTDSGLSAVTYENKSGVPYFIMQYSGNSVASVDLRDPYSPDEAFYIASGYESSPAMLLGGVNDNSRSDISRFRYEHSPEGYVTKVTFCSDSTGRLAQDNSVYGFEYVLDEKGRIAETYFLDALGDRRLNSEGVFCRKFVYDSQDNLIEWANYNRDGGLASDLDGVISCVFSYDHNHNTVAVSFHDENAEPMFISSYGAAEQKQYYDENGNLTLLELLDEDGQPCNAVGYSAIKYTYDENGYTASRIYLNPEGEAVVNPDQNYAEIRYINDQHGNPTGVSFWDTEGNRINNIYGYAKEVTLYDDYGRELRNDYYDAEGNHADYRGFGYASVVTTYDSRGRETSMSYFGLDAEPVNISGPSFAYGYHKLETVYEYGAHTKIVQTYYNADGNPVNIQTALGEEYANSVMYIQNGEVTYLANYCADGSVFGNILEVKTDRTAQAEPFTTYKTTDEDGNVLEETVLYYQLNGVEKKSVNTEYAENGSIISVSELLYSENGSIQSGKILSYNADGTVNSEYTCNYNELGKIVFSSGVTPDSDENHTVTIESVYDTAGNLLEEEQISLRIDGSVGSVEKLKYNPDDNKCTGERYSYTAEGKLSAKTLSSYEGNVKVASSEYTYREDESVIMVTNTQYQSDGTTLTREFLDYDENGLLISATQFIYNEDETYLQLTTLYDAQQNVIYSSRILRDKDGNILEKTVEDITEANNE